MAGWDSPVLGDDSIVRARRNRSLTMEEVDAFWKQRRKPEDGGEAASPFGSPGTESPFGSLEKARSLPSPLARGNKAKAGPSSPAALLVEGFPGDDGGGAGESPSKSRDWWTRSNWAFLNEPPQEEASGRDQNYTPQFHVARIATGNNTSVQVE